MSLTLFISQAMLCSALQCWPVLVGPKTAQFVGQTLTLSQRVTSDPGYGGDVLQFAEDETTVYAIHRVWVLRPEERRLERLRQPDPRRRSITNGCVNVEPAVYDYLVRHFRDANLKVEP